MQQRDITGYVVGSAERWVFNLLDDEDEPLDPRELYNAEAVLHVFESEDGDAPIRTLDMTIEPYSTPNPTIYRQIVRGDFVGYLLPNRTYWYRVEVETRTTDQDIPIVYGALTTARQPVMRDDIPN